MSHTILALDVGEARIGVAIGMAEHSLAVPKCVLTRKSRQADLDALIGLAQESQASLWVLGLPRQADDSLSSSALKIMSFAKRLAIASKLPVVFVDEWETTVEASELLLRADVSRKKRRAKIDKIAASLILERYFKYGPLDIKPD